MATDTTLIAQRRAQLRQELLARREAFACASHFATSEAALLASLQSVLQQLETQCLGLYWPIRGEFNATLLALPDQRPGDACLALPFAQRSPLQMHYRAWDGAAPTLRDERGIPSVDASPIVPDVVLVPCVGFTRSGYRLGFGAGYFDRWMADHPHVTAVGVAWSFCEITDEVLAPQPHDQALMVVVTELGVVS